MAEMDPYFECRTYDKNGQLIKIELRAPLYAASKYNKIFYSSNFSSHLRGDDDGNVSRKTTDPVGTRL